LSPADAPQQQKQDMTKEEGDAKGAEGQMSISYLLSLSEHRQKGNSQE
jgi:hypothetical protein